MVFARRLFSVTVLILLGMLVSSAWTDGTNPEPRNNPVNPEEMARAIQQWLAKNPPMQAYSHPATQHVLAVSTKSEGPQINITSRYGINIKLECKAKGPVIAAVDQLNDRAVEINLFELAEHMGVKPMSCAEYAAVDKADRELGKITPPWQYQRAQLERSFEDSERTKAQEGPDKPTAEAASESSPASPPAPGAGQDATLAAPPLVQPPRRILVADTGSIVTISAENKIPHIALMRRPTDDAGGYGMMSLYWDKQGPKLTVADYGNLRAVEFKLFELAEKTGVEIKQLVFDPATRRHVPKEDGTTDEGNGQQEQPIEAPNNSSQLQGEGSQQGQD